MDGHLMDVDCDRQIRGCARSRRGAAMTVLLDKRDSEHRDGIDILTAKLHVEGIETQGFPLSDGRTMLVRSLGDGTSFILTGRGRHNYSIGRYDDNDQTSPPTHYAEHLTTDTVVGTLTFGTTLPEYDATASACGVTLHPWHLTAGARSA